MSWSEMAREAAFARTLVAKRPYDVFLQITNRCNMKCSFCEFPSKAATPQEELTLEEFRGLSRQLSGLGNFLISIEGGEPFVRPDLVDIVRAFAADHLPVLYTNGWYVTPEKAKDLFAAGLAQVGVSIDYPDVRHDAKRALPGAYERATRAVEMFRDAAPHGGKQVHVMTVLMKDNEQDVESLLQWSASKNVGHVFTLLADQGSHRGKGVDRRPEAGVGARLALLWDRNPHWRFFRAYLEKMDDYLAKREMPTCRAGIQTFNIDHVGNVAPCIEKIDRPLGNVRKEPLETIHRRMVEDRSEVERCQDCWTACRGFSQSVSGGPGVRAWWQLMTRMRSR
jgi:MoaA/NifB/PqqE/SkfB family radical SAM enzyme